MTLKCHFKIHLPFGNKIALKLHLQNNKKDGDNVPTIVREIQLKHTSNDNVLARNDDGNDEFIELDNFTPNIDATFRNHVNVPCDGFFIEIINRMNEMWSECASGSNKNMEYHLTSSDNVLHIRITKQRQQLSSTNVQQLINLAYTAVAIENIVSQCAFGWLLIGQYCVASFNELKTWEHAESSCNVHGGHLASISSEHDQYLIDKMLLNRFVTLID
jgi:hypothetical protein